MIENYENQTPYILEEEKMFSNHRTGGKLTAVVQQNSHHSSG
jgi:hypothetical protein